MDEIATLRLLLAGGSLWLLLGLIGGLAARLRARRLVGETLHAEQPRPRGRLILALAHVPLAIGLLLAPPGIVLPGLGLVVLSLANLAAAPGLGTRVLGLGGVQTGWRARAHADLEEWRLTGDHLRFRLGGDWLAVPCPVSLHARTREVLERVAPERESRFRR